MQYLLLIYNDEQAWASLTDEQRNPLVREYFALTDELRTDGAYVAAAPLQPTSTASTIRVRDGERVVTDGPYSETKEQLGGFYLIEAESAEEALGHHAPPAVRDADEEDVRHSTLSLRRSSRTTSRQTPLCLPSRLRTPTVSKPARSCKRMLASFSGKMPVSIVQTPARSVESIRRSSSARPTPLPRASAPT